MAKSIVLGIDAGSHTVQSVLAGWDKKENGLRVLGYGLAASSGIRRGRVFDIENAAKCIRASVDMAERKSGIRARSAFLAIGGTGLESLRAKGIAAVSRASGEVSEYDVKRVMEACQSNIEPLANREILHSYPVMFTVDGQFKTTSPVGMNGLKLECEAVFICATTKDVRGLVRAAELAGLVVEDVAASPLAASRAVLPPRHREVGALLVDVGAATSTLAVFEEGLPISLEVLPFGSANITNDLAIRFKTTIEEAEEIKKNFSPPAGASQKQMADTISARLSDILELTNKHLKKISRERLLPAGAVLTGGGARLTDLAIFTKDYLELPAQIGQLQDVRMPDGLDSNTWAVAVGLCMLAYDSDKGRADFGMELTRKTGGALVHWLKSLLP